MSTTAFLGFCCLVVSTNLFFAGGAKIVSVAFNVMTIVGAILGVALVPIFSV